MTFLQSGQAAQDENFKLRIQAAVFKLAQDVLNEDPTTDNHNFRVQLARRVVAQPSAGPVDQFVWLCAANPSIAATVVDSGSTVSVNASDGDIEFVCASNWDNVTDWGVNLTAR